VLVCASMYIWYKF